MTPSLHRRAFVAAGLGAALAPALVLSKPRTVRISKGYGVLYLPLLVMEKQRLFERHAAKHGVRDVSVDWVLLDGGNSVNDAMMAGTLDFAGAGAPGFIELWARARGIPNVEVIGISGLSTTSLSLNANRPGLTSLRDFTPADRIAVPGIRTSLSAVVLQMVAAKLLGRPHFAQLDSITVNLPHPQAMQALIRREHGVTAHFTSPPFSTLELRQPGIHRVVSSVDVLGPLTLDVVFAPKRLVDTEPALAAAFLGALDDANRAIAQDPRAAAAIYAASSGVGVSHDDVMQMLAAPETRFSVKPNQLMDYVEFLYMAGTIKAKPRAWTEMFTPMLGEFRPS
ncbi:ABC transporter substrate-binding protein [Burkholderia stagnalis]|uniref:ABC transporter substrate-binding protein n=1 Tax=Burkholderia stagnalis TaxID=1503054 RepID=UPI00075CA500|nr:ABC transporter substrate-binding protein [Burkholderia stagnalis]KVL86431.1 nitrate ABC transporter substrate-binding protein [Burkholderia stagnalis]KVL92624.1 nitrate ABC transporter substrate-binding protein [Burkholderia stagnalis]KVM12036.1 nitrate ABC transporter substrate-binding protein [Burkholderia stagnalis]KWK00126.1 nitrate ABC transporter substrate-binding protein [Burkholderia stagnalis]KWO28135.1 nitrate ABC transporter substrate-binding protein [Burkholderia stagnalis]